MTFLYPLTPIAYENESAGSFITRFIQLNSYQHPSAIYKKCADIKNVEAFISTISHQDKFESFLSKMWLDRKNYQLALTRESSTQCSDIVWKSVILPDRFFQNDLQHYCPLCLKEKEYWRKDWLLKLNFACPKHDVMLLNQCPKCLNKLSIMRSRISICTKCDADIRETPGQTCNSMKVLHWLNYIFSQPNQEFVECFKDLWKKIGKFNVQNELQMTVEELSILAYEFFCDKEGFQNSINTIVLNQALSLHPRIALLAFLSKDRFTQKYKYFIKTVCSKYEYSLIQNNENFISIQDCQKVLDLKKEAITYLIKNHWLDINSRKDKISIASITKCLFKEKEIRFLLKTSLEKDLQIHNDSQFYTLTQASKLLKVNSETIRFLIKDKLLNTLSNDLNKSTTHYIDKKSLYKFHNEKILLGALAKEFDVTPTNLTEKLACINIHPVHGPHIDQTRNNIFLRSSIKNLTRDLILSIKNYQTTSGRKRHKSMQPYEISNANFIPLKEAALILGKSPLQVAQLAARNILKKKVIK